MTPPLPTPPSIFKRPALATRNKGYGLNQLMHDCMDTRSIDVVMTVKPVTVSGIDVTLAHGSLDVTDDRPVGIVEELDADLRHVTGVAGAAEHTVDLGGLYGGTFHLDGQRRVARRGGRGGGGRWRGKGSGDGQW